MVRTSLMFTVHCSPHAIGPAGNIVLNYIKSFKDRLWVGGRSYQIDGSQVIVIEALRLSVWSKQRIVSPRIKGWLLGYCGTSALLSAKRMLVWTEMGQSLPYEALNWTAPSMHTHWLMAATYDSTNICLTRLGI